SAAVFTPVSCAATSDTVPCSVNNAMAAPTQTFCILEPLFFPRRKLASLAAIAIGETGRNYGSLTRAVMRPDKRCDDAAPGPNILLGCTHAVEHVADVADHGWTLLGGAKKAGSVKLGFEMLEQTEKLGTSRRSRRGNIHALYGGAVSFRGAAETHCPD